MSEKIDLQSLGAKRVRLMFLPKEGDLKDNVQVLKEKGAELINLLETQRGCHTGNSEAQRQISLAQTDIERAVMHGVKAQFIE